MIVALGIAITATSVIAHEQNGKDRVDYRQGAYRIMGWHMGRLGDIASGETPFELAHVRESVKHLQWAERLTATTYTHDTRPIKTSRLLPKAWNEMETFRDRGRSLKQAIDELAANVSAENESQIKSAIGKVGKACKACHEDFREKMSHE